MPWIEHGADGRVYRVSVIRDADGNPQLQIEEIAGDVPVDVFSYRVSDALTLAQKMAKGVPFTGIDTTICDLVSSTMYRAYPWRDTLRIIPPGTYPLVDSQQDYPLVGIQMMRPTAFWIVRTDISPNAVRDIGVARSIAVDLLPASPDQIRRASLQAGISSLRLEKAVRVPTGSTWELRGEYQPHPVKITSTDDYLWFADEFLEVYCKGLAYWAYRIADDKRAGEAVKKGNGPVQYSGQLALFMDGIAQMAADEDFGSIDGIYPDEGMGADGRRSTSGTYPYPYLMI